MTLMTIIQLNAQNNLEGLENRQGHIEGQEKTGFNKQNT